MPVEALNARAKWRTESLQACATLFNDKEKYECYYRQHLMARLMGARAIAEDQEKAFLQGMRHECGTGYTHKLEAMFKDVATSADLSDAYRRDTGADALAVKVLLMGLPGAGIGKLAPEGNPLMLKVTISPSSTSKASKRSAR